MTSCALPLPVVGRQSSHHAFWGQESMTCSALFSSKVTGDLFKLKTSYNKKSLTYRDLARPRGRGEREREYERERPARDRNWSA
jgi:hypothetical protein